MFGLGSILAGGYLLSCTSSVAAAAVPGVAARSFGDVGIRAVDFDFGSGPPPCPLLPGKSGDSQIISSNRTALLDIAHSSSLSGSSPNPPSPPPCTYIASWSLYKVDVKSLATPTYQLREDSGFYVVSASMDATIDSIIVMARQDSYGSFHILKGFRVREEEGWGKIMLQKGVWVYVTVVMRTPGVSGVVRLSKVNTRNAESIEPLGDVGHVDVVR